MLLVAWGREQTRIDMFNLRPALHRGQDRFHLSGLANSLQTELSKLHTSLLFVGRVIEYRPCHQGKDVWSCHKSS